MNAILNKFDIFLFLKNCMIDAAQFTLYYRDVVSRLQQTASSRINHVTLIFPAFTVCPFPVSARKVSSLSLATNARIILHYSIYLTQLFNFF